MAVPIKLAKATFPIDAVSRLTSSPTTLSNPFPLLSLSLPSGAFYFLRVLSKGRRGAAYRWPFPVHEHGRGEHLEHAGQGMLHLPEHVRAREMLVRECLGERVDRSAGDPDTLDRLDPFVGCPSRKLPL